jgi:serine phosphatase RsbU (regulator of sigma subunit)
MSQAGLAIRRRVNVRAASPSGARSIRSTQKELEIKLDELRKDYAELHTAVFEAGQVHRRLCAPRLVRYGDFEIASEIFAVRHLAGDFFTVKEFNNRLVLTLGDISGKGLAAGMWTTHLVRFGRCRGCSQIRA